MLLWINLKRKFKNRKKGRQSEAGKEFGNGKTSSSPNGEKQKNIHTDKELAKMAGVGTGTVARFNKVMNSDDGELKKKVLANEVKINTAYEKDKKAKKKKQLMIFENHVRKFYLSEKNCCLKIENILLALYNTSIIKCKR